MRLVWTMLFVMVLVAFLTVEPAITRGAMQDEIHVDYEYGDLKEVIVGVPFQIYPDLKIATWMNEAIKVLPETEAQKVRERSGKDSITIGKFRAMEKENEDLIAILQEHGVKVWSPEILTRERIVKNFGEEFVRFAGAMQQYARDPILVVGNNVIENSMGTLIRRCDILGFRRLMLERVAGSNARWVAMPGIDYSIISRGDRYDKNVFPVLEGGDVIVLGKKILVGNSQNHAAGSSEKGYLWLRSYLEPQGYDVERVRLKKDILHLDVALSVPRPGVIIVCQEAFVDGIPSYFDGWKRIEITLEEAKYLAANGLPIDKAHYILGYNEHNDGKKIQTALESCGITVYRVSFGHHTEDGGSIRCSTHPLVRRLGKGENLNAEQKTPGDAGKPHR